MSSKVAARPSSRICVLLVNSSVFSQFPEDPVETSIVRFAGFTFLTVPSTEAATSEGGETCIRDRGGCACAPRGPAIAMTNAAAATRNFRIFGIPLPPFPLDAPADIGNATGRRHQGKGQAACQ